MWTIPKKTDFHLDEYNLNEWLGFVFLAITAGFFGLVWIAILSALF